MVAQAMPISPTVNLFARRTEAEPRDTVSVTFLNFKTGLNWSQIDQW